MKRDLSLPHGRLRPATQGDLEDLTALLHGKHVHRYLCDDTVLPRATVAEMLNRSDTLDKDGLGIWAVETEDARFAGIAGLEPVSPEASVSPDMAGGIEPIVALAPGHWGKGLARAALNALIAYAREDLRLPRLVAAVDEPNTRSRHLMTACGFSVSGTAPGPAHALVLYVLALGDAERGVCKSRL